LVVWLYKGRRRGCLKPALSWLYQKESGANVIFFFEDSKYGLKSVLKFCRGFLTKSQFILLFQPIRLALFGTIKYLFSFHKAIYSYK